MLGAWRSFKFGVGSGVASPGCGSPRLARRRRFASSCGGASRFCGGGSPAAGAPIFAVRGDLYVCSGRS